MPLEIHPSTVETLYFPVRSEHPTAGEQVLSGQTIEVALPAVGAAPSSWITGAWATGTRRYGADRYYLATVATSSLTIASGTTYQPWLRIGGASGAIVKCGGTIKVSNT
jgi:hypothetical protein